MPDFLKESNGIWTLIVLLISAPVAYVVWQFRDQNAVHQIENQRKDVNLKEFHKIAEWVSGLHLVEDKIIEKTKPSEQPNNETKDTESEQTLSETHLTIENAREYGQAGAKRHLPSHSREDGAVGLQVAAVYMLRPFYCGEHGDDFRKPALNLLTAAWLALFKQVEKNKTCAEKLSKSPLGIALTEVLLADGGTHLRYHSEVFPNLYLPYLDLHLPGLEKGVLSVFQGMKCSGIQLYGAHLEGAHLKGADLVGAHLEGAHLKGADLVGADLVGAHLEGADLEGADLEGADLVGTHLEEAHLEEAHLEGAYLRKAHLEGAILWGAHLEGAHLEGAHLEGAHLEGAHLEGAHLEGAHLEGAHLEGAHLEGAHLEEAILCGAHLEGAHLSGIYLQRANLRMAKLEETNFFPLNVQYLEQVIWTGALIRPNDANYIKEKAKLTNVDWIVLPSLVLSFDHDVVEYENAKFVFSNRALDYSITHTLPIEESKDEVLEELRRLNPYWNITIDDSDIPKWIQMIDQFS
ncbi:pentapeptide repeat-containing protein [Neisseria zalophi]|nr:pentapeptide repeat-containing protein [Neisseria zalophi]